ncbi:MAG: protein kinase, partial [Planctomycetota bacterium]|nr:protein kinase [Planctomycetota bacterium]
MSGLPGRFSTNTHPDYELIRELGRGSNGVVFEAMQRNSQRLVALKLMLFSGASDPNQVSRFIREGRTLAQLDHSGIAKVHSFDSEAGNHWMAMELIKGADLSTVVKERVENGQAFSIQQGWRWFRELAEILDYCFQERVVHRDFKPSNIIVEEKTGRIVLVDFGLLKSTNPLMTEQSRLTETGEVIGTPAFMSPEQVDRSFGEVTNAVDIWALGATMFFCATGEAPFTRKSIAALCIAIMTAEAPCLNLGTGIAEKKYSELVAKCLVKASKMRPEPQDLLVELRDLEPETIVEASPQGMGMRKMFGLFVVLLILASAAYAWTLRPQAVTLIDLGMPKWVDGQVEVKGQISAADIRVQISGQDVVIDQLGYFTARVQASAQERAGEKALDLRYWNGYEWIFLAKMSPKIVGPPTVDILGADWRIFQKKAPVIEGVIGGAAARLIINGKEIKCEKGPFQYKIPEGVERSEITVKNIAGLGVTRTVECVVPKRFAKRTKILDDVEDWKRADSRSQDIALAIVTEVLGERWRFNGARKWNCGGQSHRIGTFIHRKSKIEFQLIPGGTFFMGSSAREIQAHKRFGRDLVRTHPVATGINYTTPYDAEQPRHKVTLQPFLMGAFET